MQSAISIPTGAIKRTKVFEKGLTSKYISIPTGAIKSGGNEVGRLNVNEISIPTGAIKRTSSGTLSLAFARFQFLLVRLKVLPAILEPTVILLFQFLLVRLKGRRQAAAWSAP